MGSAAAFLQARDFLLRHREDYHTAYRDFRWPELERVQLGAGPFRRAWRAATMLPALWIVEEDGSEEQLSFAQLSARSNQVANFLRELGVERGERILLMLPQPSGAVGSDARGDEARRGHHPGDDAADAGGSERPRAARQHSPRCRRRGCDSVEVRRSCRNASRGSASARAAAGWVSFEQAYSASADLQPDGATHADRSDAALLHFGHDEQAQAGAAQPSKLSGRAPVDDVLDRAQAGRRALEHQLARLGQACVELLLRAVERGRNACSSTTTRASMRRAVLDAVCRCGVTTLCAPPTVWRMLIQEDLRRVSGQAPRADRRGRAAQSRGHRAGAQGMGHHHPRRLRADRNARVRSATRRARR